VATAVFGSRSVAVDVRPLIPRNHTNLWAKAEQVRDALHDQLSRACQAIDIEPLLLSSSPFVYPAWVKFEAWQPVGQQATTRRSSAIITVDPKPYHEHPFELEVTYSARGKTRTIKRVKPLTDAEVQELVEHLVREGPKPSFRRFREAPLQFWREKNELVGLRRDRLDAQDLAFEGLAVGGVGHRSPTPGRDPERSASVPVEGVHPPQPVGRGDGRGHGPLLTPRDGQRNSTRDRDR